MTKNLRKDIIFCSRLCNKFPTKIGESKQLYKKQRNLCVTLLQEGKRNYFDIDNRILKDNVKFWKTVNSLFSEKPYQKEPISIIIKCTKEIITKKRTGRNL